MLVAFYGVTIILSLMVTCAAAEPRPSRPRRSSCESHYDRVVRLRLMATGLLPPVRIELRVLTSTDHIPSLPRLG